MKSLALATLANPLPTSQGTSQVTTVCSQASQIKGSEVRNDMEDFDLIKSLGSLHFLPLCHDTNSLGVLLTMDTYRPHFQKLHICPSQIAAPAQEAAKPLFLIPFCSITIAITGMFISKEAIL